MVDGTLADDTNTDRSPEGNDVDGHDAGTGCGRTWQPAFLSGSLILALGGLCVWFWLDRRPEPLPVLGKVPEFRMHDQNAAPFESSALEGKVWVADFIFTACGSSCPGMTKQMRLLQDRLREVPELAGQVKLISFSVDPERDTPEVLSRFAGEYGADDAWWRFLTGTTADAVLLSQQGFQLPAAGASVGIPTHSDRFGLVDREGRLRGHYRPLRDPAELSRLFADIERLVEEEAAGAAPGSALQ